MKKKYIQAKACRPAFVPESKLSLFTTKSDAFNDVFYYGKL